MSSVGQQSLKIMQYNVQDLFIELAYPLSTKDLIGLNETQWQSLGGGDEPLKPLFKLRAIAEIISKEQPDIVCLCEVGRAISLQNFTRLFLNDSYEALLIESNSERGIDNGFLTRKDSGIRGKLLTHCDWPISFQYPHEMDPIAYSVNAVLAQYLDLGKADDRRLSRDIPALQVYDKNNQLILIILLAHLKSKYDPDGLDPLGLTRRTAELKALVAIYQQLTRKHSPYVPIIVAGDLNGNASLDQTDQEFFPLYQQTDLQDALRLAGRKPYERYTHLTFTRENTLANQLDYIFLPKILHKKIVPEATYVYRYRFPDDSRDEIMPPFSFKDRALLPSDHYPVFCTFNLC
ncbi:MAG: endonuclease/exonuclease/phosphatase family protein [Oligoflexus sp.]